MTKPLFRYLLHERDRARLEAMAPAGPRRDSRPMDRVNRPGPPAMDMEVLDMTAQDAALDLDAIRARAAAASPVPWSRHDYISPSGQELMGAVVHRGSLDMTAIVGDGEYIAFLPGESQGDDDATFIAHARTDIEALLAEVERLTAALNSAAADPQPVQDEGTDPRTGVLVTAEFSDGKPRQAACGLEDCPCPEHDWDAEHPREAGLYLTFKVDGEAAVRFGNRWTLTETTNEMGLPGTGRDADWRDDPVVRADAPEGSGLWWRCPVEDKYAAGPVYRNANGWWTTQSELTNVQRLGPATLAELHC